MLDAVLRRAFVIAAVVWAVSLPVATWAASAAPSEPRYAFAAAIYAAGSFLCHQLSQRSFHLWAVQMPVCARCFGVYLGAALAASAAAGAKKGVPSNARATLMLAASPAVVTLLVEWSTGYTPGNWIRALTGLALGGAVGWVIASGAAAEPAAPPASLQPHRTR